MARALTALVETQITNQRIKMKSIFKINSVDYTAYLMSHTISHDRTFGAASATFVLNNNGEVFSDGGAYVLSVGDVVEFIQLFKDDTVQYKRFYGTISQRAREKTATMQTITLNCLDYITTLQNTDIDLEVEGTKIEVTEETLTPNYLAAPNDSLAQIFDFSNDSLCNDPQPIITIRPKSGINLVSESLQYDGFEINFANGQLILGTPLNALYNYDVVSTSYYFYTSGVYVEDILESILTTVDGYGNYIFGEASSDAVISDHLLENFYNMEGTNTDYLSYNATSSTVTIKHYLVVSYEPTSSGDPSILYLDSVEGFPTAGTGSINGDVFTWTGIDGTTLTGVSESGSNALKAHSAGSYVEFESTYPAGQIWYHTYSRITSTLNTESYEGLPGGVTIAYRDNRFGRIILSNAISLNSTISYTENYTFKTLQASGIELNRMKFKPRAVANRFEAINQLKQYLPPNYIIRTIGDDKIWASLLSQKTTADYTLALSQSSNYLEDEDLYTRVVFYRKNINPTNIMFNEGVDFVTTGEDYSATAVQTELEYDSEDGNFYIYKTTISDAGRIDLTTIKPVVYLNDVPVNDKTHQISAMPVVITMNQQTVTEVEQKTSSTDVNVRQYFYYKVRFAHVSIDPTQPIYLYDSVGTLLMTISAGDGNMDYGTGIYHVPGTSQNTTIEQISTASYVVFYSTQGIEIDYNNVYFKISKQLVPSKDYVKVTATFKYWTAITPLADTGSIIDGRHDTQVNTIFYAEPPTGLNYAILDLGQIYNIQALDLVSGFYRPDDIRKYDVNFKFTLYYSLDNVSYHIISSDTTNVSLSGGESVSFEENELGTDFSCRYLKIVLEDVQKIDFGNGVWVVAFSEVAAYDDIILKSESKLIATSELSEGIDAEAETINVLSTDGFSEPTSGADQVTAYVGEDAFTYTGLTSTSFTGVEGVAESHSLGTRVSQQLEDSTHIYDDDYILPKLGDRLYKDVAVSDDVLFTQTQLDVVSKAYLEEFYKNHTKIQKNILYAPYLRIGHTVDVDGTNYFVESVQDSNGYYTIVLGKYPN